MQVFLHAPRMLQFNRGLGDFSGKIFFSEWHCLCFDKTSHMSNFAVFGDKHVWYTEYDGPMSINVANINTYTFLRIPEWSYMCIMCKNTLLVHNQKLHMPQVGVFCPESPPISHLLFNCFQSPSNIQFLNHSSSVFSSYAQWS